MLPNWLEREEFLSNLTSMKAASWDSDNNVYMLEDDTIVVNFDNVVVEYGIQCGASFARSVDAFYCDNTGACYFVEFKNGKLDKGKIFEIKQKIYDSLLIFSDITGLTLSDYRDNFEFVLVYNEEKNPNLFNAFPAPSNSPALREFVDGLARQGGKVFEGEGLESFEKYCFKSVRKMTVDELEEKVILGTCSAWNEQ